MTVMTFTTVPVHPETLARLKRYKMGGSSYDQVLNDLMDDHPPATFLKEHLRRLQEEESVSWGSVKSALKL
jgi:hypothetical protein